MANTIKKPGSRSKVYFEPAEAHQYICTECKYNKYHPEKQKGAE